MVMRKIGEKILAIIPARGGSKGILGKNIVEVGGKPLIAWTIEAAKQSLIFDKIIVSTDDCDIESVALQYGAEVPWMRPAKLAQDDSATIDVLIYDVNRLLADQNYKPDLIMLLQPTSPLRTANDIQAVLQLHREKSASSVVSVCETSAHPFLAKKIDDNGRLTDFLEVPLPEKKKNRQNFPPAFILNGAIYLVERDVLLEQHTLYGNPTYAYVMPEHQSHDIDTHWDLSFINILINRDPMIGDSISSTPKTINH